MKQSALIVTPPPHLKLERTVGGAMRDVMLALLPISAVSVYFYHAFALKLISLCVVTALATEYVFRRARGQRVTLSDGSAALTGLFVALLFSPTTPVLTAMLATFLAVGVAKELMGGLGRNRLNPALFGRVAIIFLAPLLPFLNQIPLYWSVDTVTRATPLAKLAQGWDMPSTWELFVAFPGGALSETSPLALLVGAAFLLYRGHIRWHIPVSMLASIFVLTFILGQNPVQHLVTGGIMLGAFFMATDWVTSPITKQGKLIFGFAIGVLVVIFRLFLPPPEGVAFSILIMNAFVPLLERVTRRASFSEPVSAPTTG